MTTNIEEHLAEIIAQHRAQMGFLDHGRLLCGHPHHEVCSEKFDSNEDWAAHVAGLIVKP